MENMNEEKKRESPWPGYRRGKIVGGLIIVTIGVLLLLRQMGIEFPEWLFSWEMLVIVIGFYTGVKHNFRNPSWAIFILVGSLFLIDNFYPETNISAMIWPFIIIAFGLIMIFKPRRRCHDGQHWERWQHKWKDKWEWENAKARESNYQESDDMIESVSIFGAVKKNVISKNFKGGEVTCVFGGAEINLMQADFIGKAVLEVTQVFGGTKLIVPSHWDIQHHDLVAVMGGIEDKRYIQKETIIDDKKVLVLRGTCFFGGIEIKSYN
jgi:predicted membrane protein